MVFQIGFLPSSPVSEVELLELAREGALAAGRLCMVATMVATMVAVVAMAIVGLAPILALETQTSGTVPALEMLEYSPAPR